MSYATAWTRLAQMTVTVGVGISLLVWPPIPAILGLVVTVAGTAFLWHLWLMEAPAPTHVVARSRLLYCAYWSSCTLIATLAVLSASPPIALALVLLAVVTSPATLSLLHGRGPATPSAAPPPIEYLPQAPGPVGASPIADMDTHELCHEWRRTYLALQAARFPSASLRIVSRRQLLLDEIERRNPAAMSAWLASGARAAGGPDRFLRDTDA
jgi:hypothetical protein